MLDFVRHQLMCHGGEVQFAQVNVPEQALPLLSGFRPDVICVALIFAFEPEWVFCHVDIDPLFIVIEEDAEGRFGHFDSLSKVDSAPIIYSKFLEWKFFNVKISEMSTAAGMGRGMSEFLILRVGTMVGYPIL